jgi:cytochrome-b5 reductase
LDDHPGGRDVLMEVAGTDASSDFDFVGHSKSAIKSLAEFEVGSLGGYVNAPVFYYHTHDPSISNTVSSPLLQSDKRNS